MKPYPIGRRYAAVLARNTIPPDGYRVAASILRSAVMNGVKQCIGNMVEKNSKGELCYCASAVIGLHFDVKPEGKAHFIGSHGENYTPDEFYTLHGWGRDLHCLLVWLNDIERASFEEIAHRLFDYTFILKESDSFFASNAGESARIEYLERRYPEITSEIRERRTREICA